MVLAQHPTNVEVLVPDYLTRIPIILGSSSATRKMIIAEMGLRYRTEIADLDERAIGDRENQSPEEIVTLLGKAKADVIMSQLKPEEEAEGTLLITGDQVVVCEGKILEKPGSAEEARSFLQKYSAGIPCGTVGSIVVTEVASGRQVSGIQRTQTVFGGIPSDVIERIVEEGEVFHTAGGLMIEHPLLQPYIRKIDGTIDAVMGVSKMLVRDLMLQIWEEDSSSSEDIAAAGGGDAPFVFPGRSAWRWPLLSSRVPEESGSAIV
uniref:Maf-like protein n=1 Tax=Chromera velia CCMP2878 TaxID=1169474 RepID=A0A0G4GMM6_9ALVE|eukprot:Cvel_22574.t1-p1 / transcript=Cvel_22574.t1 / gene=Cvel_22574 / organism=Chromera_velia_CCMP2878 / gene_product=Maf-like protein DDB_G0281937, putative / transcript_product=Maf-like protein DDB_G0281937, putative / location=Cvel_scaffold2231:7905-9893(+) / protein_length=263 / sequence_SO=supercontig / SO=protein_coding / is_pseudo=false